MVPEPVRVDPVLSVTDVSLLGGPMIAGGSLLQRRRGTVISVDMDTERVPFRSMQATGDTYRALHREAERLDKM